MAYPVDYTSTLWEYTALAKNKESGVAAEISNEAELCLPRSHMLSLIMLRPACQPPCL